MAKTAWNTGASSGLGLYTARALVAAGYNTVAGARSFQGLEGEGEQGYRLPLDVTDAGSVKAFCQRALQVSGPPDVLVNCAGVLVLGACEEYQPQELRQVMDVVFFGMAAMAKEVLPLMRAKGAGTIVNFSSINGLLATPMQGAYSAGKHAVEGYSEALAMEVKPHGIHVMLVEPGDHQGGQARYRATSQGVTDIYRDALARVSGVIARDERTGLSPEKLALRVVRALDRRTPPFRLRVASLGQHIAVILHDLLPGGLFLRLLSLYYRVPGGARAPREEKA
ncbi:MAG: SDR family oxidoreductase [Clostridiales bacterium]|nr:SDR family oxidoreductase [Clostridiales bacterium]